MKAAQDKIIVSKIEGETVFMSVVQKENEIGLYSNRRLLLIVEGLYFGYISVFKETDEPSKIDLNKLKTKVPINALRTISSHDNIVQIRFKVTQSGVKKDKLWNITVKTKDLALAWVSKFDQQKQRSEQKQIEKPLKKQSIAIITSPKRSQLVSNVVNQQFIIKKQVKEDLLKPTIGQREFIKNNQPNQLIKQFIQNKPPLENRQKKNPPLNHYVQTQLNPLYQQSEKQSPPFKDSHKKLKLEKSQPAFANQINHYQEPNMQNNNTNNTQMPVNLLEMARKSYPRNEEANAKYSKNYYQIVNKIVDEDKGKSQQKRTRFKDPDLDKNNNNNKQQPIKKGQSDINNIKYNQQLWTYMYLTNPHSEVFEAFGVHCYKLMSAIVDQLAYQAKKRKYHPKFTSKDFILYNILDVQLKISLIQLAQVKNQKDKTLSKICDFSQQKNNGLEFKNYKYLYKIIGNQGKVRVPLTASIEYKGFLGYFKAISEYNYTAQVWENAIEDLQRIAKISKISLQTLRNPQKILILPLNTQFYNKINQKKHQNHYYNFEYYFIQELDSFLPTDVNYKPMNFCHRIRPELLLNQNQIQSIPGYYNLSIVKNLKSNQINKVNSLSTIIETKIQNIVSELEKLDFYPLNSKQLTDYIQSCGINMRYLGLIYKKLNLQFNRQIIAADMMARICKKYLRKTLQDVHLMQGNCQNQQKVKRFNEGTLKKVIDYLNCILGNTYESVALWKILNLHTNDYYGVEISPENIDKSYFLIALAQQCNLTIKWDSISFQNVFNDNNVLTLDNTLALQGKIKLYKPQFETIYQKVIKYMGQSTDQNFQKCVKQLNLENKSIPMLFHLNESARYLTRFLSQFVHPDSSMVSKLKFAHLKIYQCSEIPWRTEMDIMMTEIKWHMRQRKKQKSAKSCQKIIRKVSQFYGDFHPLLIQLYDLFSFFHLNQADFEDSITFAKSSLVTILKVCGVRHQKTAEAYYQLAICYLKASSKEHAANNFERAKTILKFHQKQNSVPYAIILGKLSLLHLNQSNFQMSIKLGQQCLQLLDKNGSHRQDERTQVYQVLARCFQLLRMKQEEINLSMKCSAKLGQMRTPINLERVLKICLYPILSSAYKSCSLYLDIISRMKLMIETTSYGKSYQLIKLRINEKSLIKNLQSYLQNIVEINNYLLQNNILQKWNHFQTVYERETVNDFVALTQELLYFIGEGFITGALREAL